ncbi:MAG: alpha-glucan family phosphorylase, partial [Candidatus Omnitrophica bacterium]|nr:alpha-glucan family phosphorylase [Candidatus Omnitrophota bacterium]
MENTSTKQQDTTYTFERFRSDIFQYETVYKDDVTDQQYFGFPIEPILAVENSLLSNTAKSIAYLSMEYGIAPSIYNSFKLTKPMDNKNNFFTHEVFSNQWLCDYLFKIKTDKMLDIPIYGGGLGVLAGDSMKSAADLGFSIAGIGILWNKGYFKQKFWYKHGQIPEELMWNPNSYPGLVPLNNVVEITTKEGNIKLRLWKYYVYSYDKKSACPIILLDSNLPENPEHFQKLTDQLYRSDDVWWKILQRAILGIGGIRALESLGYNIDIYHLNEGHAAFAFLEKYLQLTDKVHLDNLKKSFAYTCHTPVEAGHDRFHMNDVSRILTEPYSEAATLFGKEKEKDDLINLTYICLNNCLNINAVAQKHGEITRLQFPKFASKVKAITNGVHAHTWISQSFKDLFNKYQSVLGNWENTPENLEKVTQLKNDEAFRKDIFEAHQINKRQLMNILRHWQVDENVLTIGWARRIAGYKRPALIFHDVQKIIQIARDIGPIQIILAGKAHPNDNIGSAHIDEILDHIDQLNAYN